jgi:predicted AAA+ superfamily ATPase
MLDRILTTRIKSRKSSVMLLGPRQVGKSTLIASLAPDLSIDLADESQFLRFAKDPALLKRRLEAAPDSHLIALDEVQRVPSLLNVVQHMIDRAKREKHELRFILSGSSARKLRKGGANLLPGRVVLESMDPLTTLELGSSFDLERCLQVGCLPGIFLGGDEALDLLDAYAEVYLREEIQAEALAKDIGSFARMLDVVAIVSGSWLNYSKIASDAEIPKETIRRYVDILADTLVLFRIPAFRPKLKITRRITQADKIYLFDVGVRNALLGTHRRPVTVDRRGEYFEHWLVLQLIYLNRSLKKGWTISSYRTEGGAEVDVVVERERDIVGIEIKASRNITTRDTRGLTSLRETVDSYKPLRCWIAAQVDQAERLPDGTEVLPYLELLERIARE